MLNILSKINSFLWGTPTLLLIFFTGVTLTIRSSLFQFKYFGIAFKKFFKGLDIKEKSKMTPFQAASTALSATMGTGNIVGVAGAVALGGPGAVFWMWVSAAFCMIIKFAEIALSVHYREQTKDGDYHGGVMYYIKNALPRFFYPLAIFFCLCGVMASFGIGNLTQINTISVSVGSLIQVVTDVSPQEKTLIKIAVGIVCAMTSAYILKNDGSIGRFCEKLFPVMTILYVGLTGAVIAINFHKIPMVFSQIIIGAFNPRSVTGGAVGSVFVSMRFGMSRGVFSNEAGLGTAPTVYACSRGGSVDLGLMGIIEVFIDTIVVCSLTAITILCVGEITYGTDGAATLIIDALTGTLGKGVIFVFCPVICFFAFSSVVGWGLYGIKFSEFLFGRGARRGFLMLFVLLQIPAALFRSDAVWVIAEIFNGLMCLPNIMALLLLNNRVIDIIYTYINKDTA